MNIHQLKLPKSWKPKFTVEKINGDYVFTSTRKPNRPLGSCLNNKKKMIRKIKNKQQKLSRRINR